MAREYKRKDGAVFVHANIQLTKKAHEILKQMMAEFPITQTEFVSDAIILMAGRLIKDKKASEQETKTV